MKVVDKNIKLPIINLDSVCGAGSGDGDVKHSVLFPNSIRAIVCGPSNCGKSNLMLSILLSPNGLKFENVYIYSKSLHQPKYKYLERVLNGIIGYFPFKENVMIIPPEEALSNSIFIFDDVACDKQDKIREYFSMGRHKNIDSFYLNQSYTRIPKHLIRDNANFLIIFKQDDLNLKHIYADHVSNDMTFENFKNMCFHCWNNDDNYGFITINKDIGIRQGRYSCGLDKSIQI